MTFGSLLLAAGAGTRLRPLSASVPKPALPLLDVPLGAWPLEQLLGSFPPVLVNLSHLPDQARSALVRPGRPVEVVVEAPEPYGAGGTLRAARERLGERVVVCNCDLLSDLDPEVVMASHTAAGAAATLAVERADAGADVSLDGVWATAFVDRRSTRDAPGGRYLGMAVLETAVLDLIPDHRPVGVAETLFKELVARGEVAVHVHDGYARDVGTPESYLQASIDLLRGAAPTPPWPPPGTLAVTGGPRHYLGLGADAPDGTLGESAIVLAGSRVEPGAYVERAIVWPGETVPRGTALHDAIWVEGRAMEATRPTSSGRRGR